MPLHCCTGVCFFEKALNEKPLRSCALRKEFTTPWQMLSKAFQLRLSVPGNANRSVIPLIYRFVSSNNELIAARVLALLRSSRTRNCSLEYCIVLIGGFYGSICVLNIQRVFRVIYLLLIESINCRYHCGNSKYVIHYCRRFVVRCPLPPTQQIYHSVM